MKKKERVPMEKPPSQFTRVARMLRHIQPWLPSQMARVPTYAEMEKWTGLPETTIRGWFADKGNPTAEFLLGLLERTPERARLEILGEFCRNYPTLEHSRLSADRTVLSRLKTLIGQPRGFTYIQGGNDETRTFLISALGHSFWSLTQPPRRVLGVDVHASDWFVPVPGVVYLDNILQRDELRRAAQPVWPSLRNGENPLVILNGLWAALPELQEKTRALADRCHVMVADEANLEGEQRANRLPARTTLITVGPAAPQSRSIGLEVRAL
jgi:hypothetical protein